MGKIMKTYGGNWHCLGDEEIYKMTSAATVSQSFHLGKTYASDKGISFLFFSLDIKDINIIEFV